MILSDAFACDDERRGAFVEVQSGVLLAKLRSRLYYLSVIVTMAPLLGFSGRSAA